MLLHAFPFNIHPIFVVFWCHCQTIQYQLDPPGAPPPFPLSDAVCNSLSQIRVMSCDLLWLFEREASFVGTDNEQASLCLKLIQGNLYLPLLFASSSIGKLD